MPYLTMSTSLEDSVYVCISTHICICGGCRSTIRCGLINPKCKISMQLGPGSNAKQFWLLSGPHSTQVVASQSIGAPSESEQKQPLLAASHKQCRYRQLTFCQVQLVMKRSYNIHLILEVVEGRSMMMAGGHSYPSPSSKPDDPPS